MGEVECLLCHGLLYYIIIYKCKYTLNTCLIHHNSNTNKFNFSVVQFSGLAQIASPKKKKELIDKEIIIVHACVHVKSLKTKNTKLPYLKKKKNSNCKV